LVDNGFAINIIASIALERLNVPIKFLNALMLTIRPFNNKLAKTMGTIILPIKVGVREIAATYYMTEGEM